MNTDVILTFRPEDERARRSGKVVTRRITAGKIELAWAFFPSGLQVMAVLKKQPIIDLNIVIRNGAKHDGAHVGTAHALEHLVCKDVLAQGPHPSYTGLSRLGLDTNAYTDFERTSYWAQSQHRAWRKLLGASLDVVFRSATIDEHRWRHERPAILQEVRSLSESSRVNQAVFARRFSHVARYQHDIIGSETDVLRLTADDLRAAYDRTYHPQNALVIIQGMANVEEALAFLDEHEGLKIAAARENARIVESPLHEAGVTDDLTIEVEGSQSVERLIMRSLPFAQRQGGQEPWRSAWVIAEIFNMVDGHITQRLRRQHGLIYGGYLRPEILNPTHTQFTFNANMRAADMDRGVAAWRDMWRGACLNLPTRQGEFRALVDAFHGRFGLMKARTKLERFVDADGLLTNLWLDQNRHLPSRGMDSLTHAELDAAIDLLPRFADLHWQTIKVVAK